MPCNMCIYLLDLICNISINCKGNRLCYISKQLHRTSSCYGGSINDIKMCGYI